VRVCGVLGLGMVYDFWGVCKGVVVVAVVLRCIWGCGGDAGEGADGEELVYDPGG